MNSRAGYRVGPGRYRRVAVICTPRPRPPAGQRGERERTGIENKCRDGISIKNKNETKIENGSKLGLTSINIQDEGMNSMCMLAELRVSARWVSHLQERAE
ncbi:hypothetical protein EVAR_55361_1 [Eumeta japonica]|uniref:Uncharacterized protein n=1 Tax=Eumeta variegata TaxID=151549 RepID=A0A4C1YWF9_EUMVA|nr:hypothetical protein EVAR_55361_1 [Eumeta japonica]